MRTFITLFLVLSLFWSCVEEDKEIVNNPRNCGVGAYIDKAKYDVAIGSKYIRFDEDPVITDNCMSIKLSYSGCYGGHIMELIGDGSIGKSLPIFTNFKINDKNVQLCDAQFFETYEFDLSPLKDFFKGEKAIFIYFSDQGKGVTWKVE